MGPLIPNGVIGGGWDFVIAILLGVVFGFILESAGFGDARRLAAQFYFSELRVLKVMFTAIIVAMTLICRVIQSPTTNRPGFHFL